MSDAKGYDNKESTDLLEITRKSIENANGVKFHSRNAFATFLKINKNQTKLTFNASSLEENMKDYVPDNIELLAENTFINHFKNQPITELTLLVNHLMRYPKKDTEGKNENKRIRNTFVSTIADLATRINCALPSGETADMNTLDEGSFYAGLSTVSFSEQGTYDANLKGKVLVMHADGIGTKPNIYIELLNQGLITEKESLGFIQDGLAMNLNDILVGALSIPEQTYMTNNIVIGKGLEGKEKTVMKELERLSNQTGIIIAKNNLVHRPDFKGIELDMVLTSIYDENKVPDMKVNQDEILIGVASSGVHSNGLTGARRYADKLVEKERLAFYKQLATPTSLYDKLFNAIKDNKVSAAVNITGDAFKKVLKVLPDDLEAYIKRKHSLEPQELFKKLHNSPDWNSNTMYDYFNCGIGLILITKKENANEIIDKINNAGYKADVIGELRKGSKKIIIESKFDNEIITYN